MDVTKFTFPSALLDLITAISKSHFIAFDLELSGVPVRPFNPPPNRGKQSLQARYTETRAAAQRYIPLQLGLTCAIEDPHTGIYILQPFNIALSPLIRERLDIDRDFSFHSGAVDFLNGVGFNFQAPLAIGVPYLSRREARLALQRAEERLGRGRDVQPLVLKAEEVESIAFTERVRVAVGKWLEKPAEGVGGDGEAGSLFLGPRELSAHVPLPQELSRFERRLVHQVVQAEFPTLMTQGTGSGVLVMRIDEEREERHKRDRLREVKERVARQTGLSWVLEAVAGRSLDGLDWKYWAEQAGRQAVGAQDNFDVKSEFQRAQAALRGKPRPVVGHNCFLDLVYLYHHFVDELPEDVEEFQRRLHELFPTVVDTKYLATHECGDINPMSSLQQLAEQLENQETPVVEVHDNHSKYNDIDVYHEAGFDSLLTAEVAIRLSAKLEADKRREETHEKVGRNGEGVSSDEEGSNGGGGGVSIGEAKVDNTQTLTQTLPTRTKAALSTNGTSRFAHATAFDGLREDGDQKIDEEEEVLDFDALPAPGDDEAELTRPAPTSDPDRWTPLRLMPRWETSFWEEYGNRLRVFGTQESMFVLDPDDERHEKAP